MKNAWKIFFGIFLTLFVLPLSGSLEMLLESNSVSIPSGIGTQIGFLIFSTLLIFIFSKKQIMIFNIDSVKIKNLVLPVIGTFFLFTIIPLISSFIVNEGHPAARQMSVLQQVIFIVFLASLSEELLFRGFLQNMLYSLKSYGFVFFKIRLSLPLIISGILFGLMHLVLISTGAQFSYVIQIVLSAIIMGIIAGYFQEKHNNFIFAFIVHATANLSGMFISFVL